MADSSGAAPAAPAISSTPSAQPTGTQSTQNPQAPSQAKAEAARMLKLKVDGQDLELPESEVIGLAQQGKAAAKRFQEAAAARREAEAVIKFAKENPKEFFAKTGMNARDWAENFLLEEIKREQMSPEQKKAWENEQRLKQYEASEKAAKERAHQEQMQKLEQEHMANYDQMFVKALTESGLPKTPYTVKRMAELTLVNLKKGLNLDPTQLAKIVREDYIAEQKALFGQADGDALIELLGKDAVKKLSKAQIAKYKSGRAPVVAQGGGSSQSPRKKAEPESPADRWKSLQRKTRSFF